MPKYTAKSYLRADYVGIIKVWSDTAWPTTAWSLTDIDDTDWSNSLLYSFNQSGSGSLDEGGQRITIVIQNPPKGEFLLNIGSFSGVFEFTVDDHKWEPALVATGSISVSIEKTFSFFTIPGPNYILFGNSSSPLTGGYKTAGLFASAENPIPGEKSNDTQVGWALGTTFSSVRHPTIVGKMHPYGRVIFNRFFWFDSVPGYAARNLFFMPRSVSARPSGGGYNFEFSVSMSSTSFSGGSSVYDVQPDHIFVMDGAVL